MTLRAPRAPRTAAGRGRLSALAAYAALASVAAGLLAVLVPFGPWPFRVPFDYWGDGIVLTALVKGIAEEGPLHLSRIGAPFGADIVDWPLGMWLPHAATTLLVRLLGSAGAAINAYWLLTIVATSLTAAWSLGRLGVGGPVRFVFALLYAFLPGAFYRNTSHYMTVFPLVPLVTLLCLRVSGTSPDRSSRGERRVLLAACLAQGLSYVYYAFFGCVLLAAAAAVGWLRTRRRDLLRLAAAGALLLAVGAAVPVVPSAAYWARHGRNERLAYKKAADADEFGLKLRHLLTPIAGHPVRPFAALAERAEQAGFPLENENATARLGLVGSLGLLALLGIALLRAAGSLAPDARLGSAAALVLVALLLAQVGGLGSIFNVLVSPDIRGYNRIVVFIGFLSLYAAAVLASRLWAALSARGLPPAAGLLALAATGAFGVVDQVPREAMARVRRTTAAQFAEDEAFVAEVERRLPRGAMVFQLPHATIPVDLASRPPMGLYDPGRAYLSSASLRWSWGSVLGRDGGWHAAVERLPPERMVAQLALAGFSGAWVDRLGFDGTSRPAWADLEAGLAGAAGSPVVASGNGRYGFVDIRGARERLAAELGPEGFELARKHALAQGTQLLPKWREGWDPEWGSPLTAARSCEPSPWLVFVNEGDRELRLRLTGLFRAASGTRLVVDVAGERDALVPDGGLAEYRREVTLAPRRRVRMTVSTEPSPGGCFEVYDLRALAAD